MLTGYVEEQQKRERFERGGSGSFSFWQLFANELNPETGFEKLDTAGFYMTSVTLNLVSLLHDKLSTYEQTSLYRYENMKRQ